MDPLQQYQKQYPEFSHGAPQWQPPEEYGFFFRLVMTLSGGRVRDVRQATYILTAVVVVAVIIALFFLFSGGGSRQDLQPSRGGSFGLPPAMGVTYPTLVPR